MTGHLIHIGFPKTASNWLRRWFSDHPQIAFAPAGIAGYGNIYGLVRDAAVSRPEIRFHVTSSEALSLPHPEVGDPGTDLHRGDPGEIPGMQERACELLRTLFPNAHILIVTRGFAGLWRSGYSQFVRTGGDPAAYAGRVAGTDAAPPRLWDYNRIVGLYERAFPGRVLVLPYELLRDDPAAFVAAVADALGLDPAPPPSERLNPSLGEMELRWYPRLTRLVRRLPLGERARSRLFRSYVRRARTDRLRPLIRFLDLFALRREAHRPTIADTALERLRGQAECLRGRPHFGRYSEDYLL